MSKNYDVLNELVPKTQELHRAIFDKGYEQGRQQVIDKIRAEIENSMKWAHATGDDQYAEGFEKSLEIIDKYKSEREDKEE